MPSGRKHLNGLTKIVEDRGCFLNAVTFIGFLYAQLLSSHVSWQEMVEIYNEIPTMFTKNKYRTESVAQLKNIQRLGIKCKLLKHFTK